MARSDRERLLERALALPQATSTDFFGGRRAPADAEAALLKRSDDTSLRTKLIEVRLAEGLQSPKGPQKIASILRIYPDFDAPQRASNGRRGPARGAAPTPQRGLPSVDEMERLIGRIRDVEREVARELGSQVDERIVRLKGALVELDGDELDRAYRELGEALDRKRALASQIRFETFERIEGDAAFEPRSYLRLLRR
jgi:hypothetical protein